MMTVPIVCEKPLPKSSACSRWSKCTRVDLGFVIICFLFIVLMVLVVYVGCTGAISPSPKRLLAPNNDNYLSSSDYYAGLSEKHQFTQVDNCRLDNVDSPRLHPTNGKSIMYLRKQYYIPNLNSSTRTLHWIDIETNKTIQLTRPIWGIYDQQFYWVDDKTVLFLSNRGKSGLTQLFQLNLPDDVSATGNYITPIQITDYPLNIDNLLVNRQGTRLAFSCQVYFNLSIDETAIRQAMEKQNGNLVYKFDKLFIRHWNEYILGIRHHPFVVKIEKNPNGIYYFVNKPRDVLFGIDSDSPIRQSSSDGIQWSFSASGNKFAFARRYDESSKVAWTTNVDIFTMDLTNPISKPVCITEENLAGDACPLYSPIDDNILLYQAYSVLGQPSMQRKMKLYNGLTTITLFDDWDRKIEATTWSQDNQSLFLEVEEHARNVIYKVSNIFSPIPTFDRLISVGSSKNVNIHPLNNDIFVFTHSSLTEPQNIYLYSPTKPITPMTTHNQNWMNKVHLSKSVELFSFTGAQNETVWGWHMAPITGTIEKAPLAFLIHGGPFASYSDEWLQFPKFQFFASHGYAVIAINFHGSTSYGQKFADSIIGQFGSLPFEDLKLGLTAALNRYSYIDGNRAVAFGASYGGYMINWMAGHPEMSQRFKTLISDAGIFNLKDFAYSTDELGGVESSVGGFTPYENPEVFERFNPVNHVINWTQPMLIIHGARDYRVPDNQGISAFNALQRRGIPSRMIYFPTEDHSISQISNVIVYHEEILHWMNRWTA